MCGLVGSAGKLGIKEENAFKHLLELDTSRGPHSTGVLGVDPANNTEIVKKLGTPWHLYEYKAFDEIMRSALCVLMGHNRWATKGKISERNAHPFEHEHIIGAHNGTLRNQQLLDSARYFDVDSDNIFYHMSQHGVDDTVKKLNGAYALTWYNSKDKSINFFRNSERPLFYAISSDNMTIFWASEEWMLTIALRKQGINHHMVVELPVGMLFTFPLELTYVPKTELKAHVRKVEMFSYPPVQKHVNGNFQPIAAKVTEVKKPSSQTKGLDLVNREFVEFFVSSEKLSSSRQMYIEGVVTEDDCEIKVRVYPTAGSDMHNLLLNSKHYFKGKANSFVEYGGESYVVLRLSSVEEVPYTPIEDNDTDEFAVGFNNVLLTEAEFYVATTDNCAWCGDIAIFEDSDEIEWVGERTFLCGDCKHKPEVLQYTQTDIKKVN